ncbi:hypothetical protein CerSpe_236520 [Prunus speciosa]
MAKEVRLRYMQTCGEVAPSLLISHHCQHHQVQRCSNNYPKLEAIIEEGCHAHDESFQVVVPKRVLTFLLPIFLSFICYFLLYTRFEGNFLMILWTHNSKN